MLRPDVILPRRTLGSASPAFAASRAARAWASSVARRSPAGARDGRVPFPRHGRHRRGRDLFGRQRLCIAAAEIAKRRFAPRRNGQAVQRPVDALYQSDLGGRFFQDHVCVGPAEAERTDARPTRAGAAVQGNSSSTTAIGRSAHLMKGLGS